MQELYEIQKSMFENLEDISSTQNSHENLSEQLTNNYQSIIVMQQSDIELLEKERDKITPDEKRKNHFQLNAVFLLIY